MSEDVVLNNDESTKENAFDEKEVKDIIKMALKSNKKNKNIDEKVVKNEILEHIEFLKKLNEIDMIAENRRIIFTDGNDQLLYTDGEFYLIDTVTDVRKKKVGKKQARDMYIEYFITYILNPMIEKNNMQKIKEDILKVQSTEEKTVESKPERKTSVKQKIDKVLNKNKEKADRIKSTKDRKQDDDRSR